jgi:hypothetical protein
MFQCAVRLNYLKKACYLQKMGGLYGNTVLPLGSTTAARWNFVHLSPGAGNHRQNAGSEFFGTRWKLLEDTRCDSISLEFALGQRVANGLAIRP